MQNKVIKISVRRCDYLYQDWEATHSIWYLANMWNHKRNLWKRIQNGKPMSPRRWTIMAEAWQHMLAIRRVLTERGWWDNELGKPITENTVINI